MEELKIVTPKWSSSFLKVYFLHSDCYQIKSSQINEKKKQTKETEVLNLNNIIISMKAYVKTEVILLCSSSNWES